MDAKEFVHLVGRTYIPKNQTVSAALAQSCVLHDDIPDPKRILAPRSMATMDFRPDRLNVVHDDKRIITRVYYG